MWIMWNVRSSAFGQVYRVPTCGEADLLVTLGELDVEVGDECVDIIIPLDLQTDGWSEGQVLWLHRVDVYLLKKTKQVLLNTHFNY